MLIIRVKENESIDRAIRRYRRKVQNTGLIKEYRRKQVYLKPSTRKRQQLEKAKYREQMRRRLEDA
ncbi:MAG: 30S ribosomal protein S21 [Bacteroidetes bacterium]|nr:MAG: 30S ribosomal protein S21 [Bacteroidota bacterium]